MLNCKLRKFLIPYSPFVPPSLDEQNQPTQRVIENRRPAKFITPVPKLKKRKKESTSQQEIVFNEGKGLSTESQQYDPNSRINSLRRQVDQWPLADPSRWRVTHLIHLFESVGKNFRSSR